MLLRVTGRRAKEGKECPICGGSVPLSLGFRPRIYCSKECLSHAQYAKKVAARDRRCPGCQKPMPALRRPGRPPGPRCNACQLIADTKQCARCAKNFISRSKAKYCSSACRRKPLAQCSCGECGAAFTSSRALKQFCSSACHKSANAKRLVKQNKASAAPPKTCLCCNKPFHKRSSGRNAGKYCSRECAFEARRLRLPCTQLGRRHGTPLSSHLAVWFHNWGNDGADPVEQGLRCGGHKARCRHYGCHYEPFPDRTIFDRDGWKCQLCGVDLLPKWINIPGTKSPDPRSPEIDHIVPLSAGPSSPGHTPLNCQAACRRCNSRKSNRPHSFAARKATALH
jgi:hypothetical protein